MYFVNCIGLSNQPAILSDKLFNVRMLGFSLVLLSTNNLFFPIWWNVCCIEQMPTHHTITVCQVFIDFQLYRSSFKVQGWLRTLIVLGRLICSSVPVGTTDVSCISINCFFFFFICIRSSHTY